MSVMLSAHFNLGELTTTSQAFANTPDAEAIEALRQLCTHVLEPWRLVAGPLKITSGFRSPDVNRAVHGSRTSQHLRGEACDTIPVSGRGQAWDALVYLVTGTGLPVDQGIIYEDAPHIHVSHTGRYPPRREMLVHLHDGRYVPWAGYHGVLRGRASSTVPP